MCMKHDNYDTSTDNQFYKCMSKAENLHDHSKT